MKAAFNLFGTLKNTRSSSGVDSASTVEFSKEMIQSNPQESAKAPRRNRPGVKFEEAYQWKPLPFDEIDSVFALQEYLQSIIRDDRENITRLLEVPDNQNPDVWQYEHFKQICLELNYLVVQLYSECSKISCPEMKADEWLYLCAAHPTPQGCCAIDYVVHTLDGATAILNSNKYFPSRMNIHETSKKHYQSIARRLYRIFAHSWFHHREVFDEFENETFLYARFMALSAKFDLIPNSLIIIPDLALSD